MSTPTLIPVPPNTLQRLIREDLTEQITTSNDKAKSAHIVLPVRGEDGEITETAHALVMRARVEGFPVTALCGHTWVPNKQATGLPVCQPCKDIYDHNPNGMDRDGLPGE